MGRCWKTEQPSSLSVLKHLRLNSKKPASSLKRLIASMMRSPRNLHKLRQILRGLRTVPTLVKPRSSIWKKNLATVATHSSLWAMQKKCKGADARVDFAERTVAKLQKDVDRLEDDLANEKERYRGMTDELDQTFNEISGY